MNQDILVLRSKDLPKAVEVIGDHGEREFYMLRPASRKFGASLQGVDEPLRQALMTRAH